MSPLCSVRLARPRSSRLRDISTSEKSRSCSSRAAPTAGAITRRRPTPSPACARAIDWAALPSDPDPAFAGIALAAIGKLAIEAGEQPGIPADGELGARVDACGVA